MSKAKQEKKSQVATKPDSALAPPRSPLETLAAFAQATFPSSKIVMLVDAAGQFQMASVNVTSAADRVGMIESARILARVEFAEGYRRGVPVDAVQSETKSKT